VVKVEIRRDHALELDVLEQLVSKLDELLGVFVSAQMRRRRHSMTRNLDQPQLQKLQSLRQSAG